MFRKGISSSALSALTFGSILLAWPHAAAAQRHGGGGMASGGGGISGISRPTGVGEKDSLKDFHQALALQASTEQIAEFQALIKDIELAQTAVQAFIQPPRTEYTGAESPSPQGIDDLLQKARNADKKFQEGFSPAQKAGLKDIAKRLSKTDVVLDQDQKSFDQSLTLKESSTEIASRAESLGKALTDFYNQQLSLGRAMSITLASGQDVAFTLPPVKREIQIERQTIAVTVAGALSQTAARADQRTFKLEMVADLSDVQQNITDLLRAQLDTSETCGQRIAIQQATLTPAAPASLLIVRLHFERWMCSRSFGQQISTELAEGDGTVEINLKAAVEQSNSLKIVATIGRIGAPGMLEESLRSGSLGEDLPDKVAATVLSAARAGSDFKTALPPAVQNSAALQSARFQTVGVGGLSLVLDGQIEISNAQADQLASQLNQTLSAQGAAAH
jgi:hypothetical protein